MKSGKYTKAHIYEAQIKCQYGISVEEYANQRHVMQRNTCPICFCLLVGIHKENNSPVIDHNHITGEFRGILCHKCNRALGCFQDNIDILELAVLYLQKHK